MVWICTFKVTTHDNFISYLKVAKLPLDFV